MPSEKSTDDIRRAALDSYESMDKYTKIMIAIAGVAEISLGVLLVWLTNFSDPVQRLIFVAAATVYMPLACCVGAVFCHVERNTQRMLKAVELLRETKKPRDEQPSIDK